MTISLPELLLAIVLLPLGWIVLDWIFEVLGHRRTANKLRSEVRTCHLCGKSYREERQVKLSTCPTCLARNDRRGHRKLG
jgi:uncharacterized paraquat-inducible protein A